jgi:tetratricopeptide (TPR) repeat protein
MKKGFLLVMVCTCFGRLLAADQSIENWLRQADSLLAAGKVEEAARLHEQVISQDPGRLESLFWLGNYHYLNGETRLKKLEKQFEAIREPNRMQEAYFQEELKRIYTSCFAVADTLLKQSLNQQKNEHIQKLVDSIELYRQRIGLIPPAGKKRSQYLLQFFKQK